jgi:hypothetical protein
LLAARKRALGFAIKHTQIGLVKLVKSTSYKRDFGAESRSKNIRRKSPKSLAEQGFAAIIAGSLDLAGPGVGHFWSKRIDA